MQSDTAPLEAQDPASTSTVPLGTSDDGAHHDDDGDKHSSNQTEPASQEQSQEQQEELEDDHGAKRRNLYTKMAITLVLLGFITFVIVDSVTNQYVKTGIENFLEWMEENPAEGFFAFVLLCFLTTMLFIPGILLTVGSGFVFSNTFGLGVGILAGTVAAFLGSFSGSVVSFLLGRFLLRDCVSGLTKKFTLLEALDSAFEEKGFRIMVLLRLSPLIYASPYLNYGAGGTSISFWDYTLAMFAILPGTVMFVFLGASAGSLADGGDEEEEEEDSVVTTIVLVVGIVISVVAVACTSYYAKVELNKIAAAASNQDEGVELLEEAGSGSTTS
jgi:uncharacterized membrane protein YdjX (TVP38/TMEM64 family)